MLLENYRSLLVDTGNAIEQVADVEQTVGPLEYVIGHVNLCHTFWSLPHFGLVLVLLYLVRG